MLFASSFADPEDVRRFHQCKLRGGSDITCFRVGDNGKGCWGDDTTVAVPICALPPEDFQHLGNFARNSLVWVRANGREVYCFLRDRMPAKRFIKNGASIDLNPEAAKQLGLRPPFLVECEWRLIPRATAMEGTALDAWMEKVRHA